MSKHGSLFNQARRAICACFKEGIIKKDAKDYQVTSYTSRFELIDFVKMVMTDVKGMYPELRDIKYAPKSIFNDWLSGKAKTCTQRTLAKYADNIEKTGKCVNHHIPGAKVEWSSGLTVPKSQKNNGAAVRDNKGISQEDYNRCIEWGRRPGARSKAVDAWELSRRFNVRVDEVCKVTAGCFNPEGGKHGYGTFHIKGNMGKNGRQRCIDVRTSGDAAYLSKLCEGKARTKGLFR